MREGLFASGDVGTDVRGVVVNVVDLEFVVLRLQLAKCPQRDIRSFRRQREETQRPAWWCGRGRDRHRMLRVKFGLVEIEFVELGEIADEVDECVQSEENTRKR